MSIDRGIDREDEVIYTMENYSSIENNETMPSVATWVDLEIHAKSIRKRQVYDITYMWNLKYDTKEHIYKPETSS